MFITPSGLSRVRAGRRLTVSAATAACLLALPLAGTAHAQSSGAAAAQYNVPPVTTTTPATADPDSDVANNGDSTSTGDGEGTAVDDAGGSAGNGSASGSGSGSGAGGTGSGVGSGAAAAGTSGTSATTSATRTPTPVDYAAFGLADIDVRDDVRAALTQGGLQYRYVATTNKKVVDFIGSSQGEQLSTGGARPIGRRVGQELTTNGAFGPGIFTALFGTKFSYRPFTATVLTRGDDVSARQVAFLRGLAAGFGGAPVPTVYVERSDDKESHVDEFEDIPGVSVVDDIDTAAGKQELVSLLTSGPRGAVPGANGGSIDAQTRSAIVNVGDDSSTTTPLLLLVLVVLGGVAFTGGTLVRRRR